MKAITFGLALSMVSGAVSAQIVYTSPPTIFNSAIEVLPEINNSSGFKQGPLDSFGPVNLDFTDTISLSHSVSSTSSLGTGSVTAQGTIDMSATVTAHSISGSGSLTTNAVLGGGASGGAGLLSDGSADFDIHFSLSQPEKVSLAFSASSFTSLLHPNNLAVAFLAAPDFSTILRAESTGTGSQSVTWSGVLTPGDYFLRGAGDYEDFVTTSENMGSSYRNSESFTFNLQVVSAPEPSNLGLCGIGLLGLLAQRCCRSRRYGANSNAAVEKFAGVVP